MKDRITSEGERVSDTAKELRARIDEAFERGDHSPIMRAEMLDRCLARIEQLERGIERANKSSAFIPEGVNLMQLIEELGND